SDARSPKRPPANNPATKFLCCPSKLSFWINISATFLTVPASKSRVSWVQGCFSALAQTFNRVHCGGCSVQVCCFVCRCLHLPGFGWIRGCSDVLLSGRHRGHAELFCDELSRSRGLSHGTGECESNLFGDFSLQWIELRRDWIFRLDQRRKWISVGCEDIRSEFRIRPQHGTHMDRSADV